MIKKPAAAFMFLLAIVCVLSLSSKPNERIIIGVIFRVGFRRLHTGIDVTSLQDLQPLSIPAHPAFPLGLTEVHSIMLAHG